jgi:pilus assembly protein CpaB
MTRRILTVALALVLAVLGAVGVLDYVHQADQRALAGMRAVTAYVAKSQIPAGISAGVAIREGLLVSQQFPASSVPADAVRSVSPAMAGFVLTGGLASGQMLLSPMLGTSVQTAAALPVPPGMVAVTLQFCAQQAVANFVTPGSQVAVFNTFVNGKAATGACSADNLNSAHSGLVHTRLVLPRVLVLAVGEGTATPPSASAVAATDPATSSSSSSPSTIYVTMAVSQVDAERLIELGEAGSPYLALVTSASGAKADVAFQP